MLPQGAPPVAAAPSQRYVLGSTEGEHLVHFSDDGNIYIKAGAATGSDGLDLGNQQVTLSAGVPVHRHLRMDEAFYVLEGSGIVALNDTPHTFEKGATIFIPRNSWHGFSNRDHELLILWIISPPTWTAFLVRPAVRRALRQSNSPASKSTRSAIKFGTEFR